MSIGISSTPTFTTVAASLRNNNSTGFISNGSGYASRKKQMFG